MQGQAQEKETLAAWPADNPERRSVASLVPYANNPMTHTPEQVDQLARSMQRFGWTNPVLVDDDGGIIAGHGRVMAAMKLGIESIPVIVAKGWSEAEKRAYLVADNQLGRIGVWDRELLKIEIGEINALAPELLSLTGFADLELVEFISGLPGNQPQQQAPIDVAKTLAERFGIPPFSVLNAREGWWQERKRAWIALGIQSELGRGENLLKFSDSVALDGKAYNERFKGKARAPAPAGAVLGGEV